MTSWRARGRVAALDVCVCTNSLANQGNAAADAAGVLKLPSTSNHGHASLGHILILERG